MPDQAARSAVAYHRRVGPRIFGIPASHAATVAVIRRGPSGWCHVGRWEPDAGTWEAGSWLHGTIYPQRCDLSPDGRWLVYFALKGGARWDIGATYLAVSRLPWLTALVAWGTGGTWTRGLHFVEVRRTWDPGDPDEGDPQPLRRRFGLAGTRAATFAVERRRGWTETADTPQREAGDAWDEQRAERVTLEKPRPGTPATLLLVSGRYAAFRDMGPSWGRPRYALMEERRQPLAGVQWADWDRQGRLLVATDAGELQVRDAPFDGRSASWSLDLARLRPQPIEPPEDARRW